MNIGDRIQVIGRSSFAERHGVVVDIDDGDSLALRVRLDGDARVLCFGEHEVVNPQSFTWGC